MLKRALALTLSLLLLFLLILVNAFFAASEIAVITLNDNKIKKNNTDTTENPDFPTRITRKTTICTPQYTGLIS